MSNVTFITRQRDINHNQLSPSQANRTEFTPGKASSLPLDQNWAKDFHIYTGIPAVDALIDDNRLVNQVQVDASTLTVGQQDFPAPTSVSAKGFQGEILGTVTSPDSHYVVTDTDTVDNNGSQEKWGGYNGFVPLNEINP